MPECYHNCHNWAERYDQKCARFYYGIHHDKNKKGNLYSATLKIKKWGQLESRVCRGSVRAGTARFLDGANRALSLPVLWLSKLLKPISPTCKPSGAFEFIKEKLAEGYRGRKASVTESFLFQAYSRHEQSYNFLMEVLSGDKQLVLRKAIPIRKGYNQCVLPVDPQGDVLKPGRLVRLYPENDFEAELTIFFADFVHLRNAKKQIIPEKPAEKVKCVAWDLDNTLWDGILIEGDPKKLKLRGRVLEAIEALDQKGILQVVVSKNYDQEADAVLKALGIDEYFVYKMINWNPKSGNLAAIAETLNINLDTFAFIDDSAFERGEVQSQLPCVRVYDETVIGSIHSLPEFDVPVTEVSKERRKLYQKEIQRSELKVNYSDGVAFLKACEIRVTVARPADDQTALRSYELIQRTNQLNLSGMKYEENDFYALIRKNMGNCYVLFAQDKFGSYGQVAFFMVEATRQSLSVTEFAMSCRVANKCIESGLIKWLQTRFNDGSIREIVFKGVNSKKNMLLIDTLKGLGMRDIGQSEETLLLSIGIDALPANSDVVTVKADGI